MDLIVWSHVYSVGVEVVDEQHKMLMKLINEVHEIQEKENLSSKISEVLKKLVDYTVYHFQTEEKLFQEQRYPEYVHHKACHDKLIQEVSGHLKLFEAGDSATREKLMVFLTDWLKDHILGEDKKFGQFRNRQSQDTALEDL